MSNAVSAAGIGLPTARLYAIHDCLALALDATENPEGYPQPLREARSYMRDALRQTKRLIGGAQ
jgi:hypothetical protein